MDDLQLISLLLDPFITFDEAAKLTHSPADKDRNTATAAEHTSHSRTWVKAESPDSSRQA